MLDYDVEAAGYDETRGGVARAAAAAAAVARLLPPDARTVVDIAGGTGLVGRHLTAAGHAVVVVDGSLGMLRLAATRLLGRVIQGDARRLPLADGSLDGASTVWLLHLLPDGAAVAAVLGEIARVLRPGGIYVTTVDKTANHHRLPADPAAIDAEATVIAAAAQFGLAVTGRGSFVGIGQGRPGVGDGADPVFPLLALRRDGTASPAGRT